MTVKMFIMIAIDKIDFWMIILCALNYFWCLEKELPFNALFYATKLELNNQISRIILIFNIRINCLKFRMHAFVQLLSVLVKGFVIFW